MDNTEAIEYLNQARTLFAEEKYEDSLEFINKAISKDKMNKEFYIHKCIILVNLDRYDEAVIELNNALKIDKEYADAYFHLGNIALLKGDKATGIDNYNKAIAYGVDGSQIFFNLGLMYEDDGEDELALRNYTKAIQKEPLRVDARIRKANIYMINGKQQEALETLNELILADPDLYDGYHLKAVLLSDMGNYDEAMAVLDEAMQLFPEDPAFPIDKINISILKQDSEQAKELLKDVEQKYDLEPIQSRELELEKARIYALEEDIDKVVECLKKAKEYTKELDPDDIDTEATFLLVNCYLELKDYQSAIINSRALIDTKQLEYAIPCYYTLPFSYAQSGDEELAKKQYKDSISELRAITLEEPGLLDGYLYRSLCHRELGEYDKALELADYLLTVDDTVESFHILKSEILSRMSSK